MAHTTKRTELKEVLSRLSEKNHHVFKLMYSHKDLNKDINKIVDDMPAKQLDWAIQQAYTTYYSLLDKLKESYD